MCDWPLKLTSTEASSQRRQELRGSVSEKDRVAVGCLRARVLDEMRLGSGVESDGDGGDCEEGVCVTWRRRRWWRLVRIGK